MRDAEILRERINTASIMDPFIGKYYSTNWVRKNVLQMTEEEIETMEAEIEEEGSQPVLGDGQESAAAQGQAGATEFAPEDNTQESSSQESLTPQLDDSVNKYAFNKTK